MSPDRLRMIFSRTTRPVGLDDTHRSGLEPSLVDLLCRCREEDKIYRDDEDRESSGDTNIITMSLDCLGWFITMLYIISLHIVSSITHHDLGDRHLIYTDRNEYDGLLAFHVGLLRSAQHSHRPAAEHHWSVPAAELLLPSQHHVVECSVHAALFQPTDAEHVDVYVFQSTYGGHSCHARVDTHLLPTDTIIKSNR